MRTYTEGFKTSQGTGVRREATKVYDRHTQMFLNRLFHPSKAHACEHTSKTLKPAQVQVCVVKPRRCVYGRHAKILSNFRPTPQSFPTMMRQCNSKAHCRVDHLSSVGFAPATTAELGASILGATARAELILEGSRGSWTCLCDNNGLRRWNIRSGAWVAGDCGCGCYRGLRRRWP